MKYRIKRKIGYVLVVAMLVVMIYPGELSAASGQEDGFVIKGTTLQGYVGAENAVVIPDNITKIDDDVFLNTTITSVEIPDSVTTIGDNAFAGCEYLTEVTVPDSVTKIGDNVFYGLYQSGKCNMGEQGRNRRRHICRVCGTDGLKYFQGTSIDRKRSI